MRLVAPELVDLGTGEVCLLLVPFSNSTKGPRAVFVEQQPANPGEYDVRSDVAAVERSFRAGMTFPEADLELFEGGTRTVLPPPADFRLVDYVALTPIGVLDATLGFTGGHLASVRLDPHYLGDIAMPEFIKEMDRRRWLDPPIDWPDDRERSALRARFGVALFPWGSIKVSYDPRDPEIPILFVEWESPTFFEITPQMIARLDRKEAIKREGTIRYHLKHWLNPFLGRSAK